MLNDEKLVKSLGESISPDVADICVDLTENIIDEELSLEGLFGNSELLEAIPVIKTGLAIIKTGFHIRDTHLLKKTLLFLKEFSNKTIALEKIEKYRRDIAKTQILNREINHVSIMLDNYAETKKSVILGRLYVKYIEGRFAWDKFEEFSYILERIFIKDLDFLGKIINSKGVLLKDVSDRASLYRLNSVGLINKEEPIKNVGDMFYAIAPGSDTFDYVSNDTGKEFYEFGMK